MNQLLYLSFGLLNWSGQSINAIRLLFCSHPSALPSLLRVKTQVLTRNCMIWHSVTSDPLPSPLLPHSAAATSAPFLFLKHTHVPALGSIPKHSEYTFKHQHLSARTVKICLPFCRLPWMVELPVSVICPDSVAQSRPSINICPTGMALLMKTVIFKWS